MKTVLKITFIVTAIVLMAPETHAIFGVWRRTAFRTAVCVGAMSSAEKAQAQQQTAAAQQQAAAATAQAAAATAEAAAAKAQAAAAVVPRPPPAPAGQPLPMGAVVAALPPGCVPTPVGGVEYYYGGGNFYKAVFQGNNLVYVTVQPK